MLAFERIKERNKTTKKVAAKKVETKKEEKISAKTENNEQS